MYQKRLKILLGLLLTMICVLVARLCYMQVSQGEYYRDFAARSLESVQFLPGQRGQILDRNGVILAQDKACHDLCLDFRLISKNERWQKKQIRRLMKEKQISKRVATELLKQKIDYTWNITRQVADASEQDLDRSISKIKQYVKHVRRIVGRDIREQYSPHSVISALNPQNANRLREMIHNGELIGASLKPSHYRWYPHKHYACHIIGNTGQVFREEANRYNLSADQAPWLDRMRTNYIAGDTIGKTGVEAMCEKQLRAKRGYRRLRQKSEIDAGEPARDGKNIRLTIDIELQKKLTDLMADSGHNGSIVIVDVPSGDILAMVSWPAYDLNTYRKNYRNLLADNQNFPLIHRAAGGRFEPGSTVKPLVAIAALASNKLNGSELINCPGYTSMYRGRKVLRCWNRSGHGQIALRKAIQSSCNVFFARLADRLTVNGLVSWLNIYGFGKSAGTGLPEENRGVIATPEWVRTNRDGVYYPSDRWFMSVGQGVFAATPLQVANAHAAIARGGDWKSARISIDAGPVQQTKSVSISSSKMKLVHEAMWAVVHERGGTARRYFAEGDPLGVEVCGKTGTAQTGGRGENHAWFAGFAPYRKPQISIAVLAEHGGSGGRAAGPIAKKALMICKQFGYLGGE